MNRFPGVFRIIFYAPEPPDKIGAFAGVSGRKKGLSQRVGRGSDPRPLRPTSDGLCLKGISGSDPVHQGYVDVIEVRRARENPPARLSSDVFTVSAASIERENPGRLRSYPL